MTNFEKSEFVVGYVMGALASFAVGGLMLCVSLVFTIAIIEAGSATIIGLFMTAMFWLITIALLGLAFYMLIPLFTKKKKATQ